MVKSAVSRVCLHTLFQTSGPHYLQVLQSRFFRLSILTSETQGTAGEDIDYGLSSALQRSA